MVYDVATDCSLSLADARVEIVHGACENVANGLCLSLDTTTTSTTFHWLVTTLYVIIRLSLSLDMTEKSDVHQNPKSQVGKVVLSSFMASRKLVVVRFL